MNRGAGTVRQLLLLIALSVTGGSAHAQALSEWDTGRLALTRSDLEELLLAFERATESTAYSAELRERARYEAGLVRERLSEGDLQVGDQVTITVEGEAQLTGSFTVLPGRVLVLPTIGEVPLRGTLRSELENHLTRHLSRYLREPVVHATSSMRLLVSGAVGSPGFYLVEAESLLSDVIMTAGGFSGGAELTRIRVERGEQRIWDGAPLQQAIAEGRTLDQLSLRAGDHVMVPEPSSDDRWSPARLVTSLPAVLFALTTLSQIF